MNVQIWTQDSKNIKGSVVFEHRGFEISVSTLAQPNQTLIFAKGTSIDFTKTMTGNHQLGATALDVAAALAAIDVWYLTY